METTYDSSALSFPIVVPIMAVASSKSENQKNIEALLSVFEDDLLNEGLFFNKLRKYALERTGDYQLGEDAVADFYCNVVRKVKDGRLDFKYPVERKKGIEGNPKMIPWAYACINNSCIDLQRRRYSGINKIMTSCSMSREQSKYNDSNPKENAMQNEKKRIIEKGLEFLDKKHREVIRLCYFEGYKYMEAAELLNVPLGTIKSRMNNALKDLREILHKYNPEN